MLKKNSDEMNNRVRVPARRGFLFSVTLGRRDRQVVVIKVHTNAYTLFTRMTSGSHCSTGLSQKQKISYGIKFASMTDGNVEVPVSL
jgi:hypothetical protein